MDGGARDLFDVTGSCAVWGCKEAHVPWLIAAALVWSLSFALIGSQLRDYDPVAVSAIRLGLASLAFSPLLLRQRLPWPLVGKALGLGAIQFGLMYVLYISSYQHMDAWAVAVFTVFTPLYVAWIGDAMERRWAPRRSVADGLAVAGAALIAWSWEGGEIWLGVLLLQGSNLCFAVGQLGFRRLAEETKHEGTLVAWMYLGGLALAGLGALLLADPTKLAFDGSAWATLLYLGLIPTAVGFYLWNKGASRTTKGRLAAANNLKIPLAVVATWLLLREEADYLRVGLGLAIIVGALFLAEGREGHRT